MTTRDIAKGPPVFDPRGIVEAEPAATSPRVHALDGLRLAVLDNTKWKAGALLAQTVAILEKADTFAQVNTYKKESFSFNALPELIAEIAANNDIVLTAIGD